MGRHRRTTSASAPSPAPAAHHGHAHHGHAYTEPAHLASAHPAAARPEPALPEPAPVEVGPRHRGEHRKRGAAPVRTGLLGASAAMAMGAVAVASGLIPGPAGLGGARGDRVQADGPTELESPSLPPAPASERASDEQSPSRAEHRDDGPTSLPSQRHERPDRSKAPAEPSASPSRDDGSGDANRNSSGERDTSRRTEHPSTQSPERSSRPSTPSSGKESGGTGSGEGADRPTASATPDPETDAEAEVLSLVNQERAKAGCRPVKADPELAGLAGDFSEDMARRGFFDHDTPDGKSPWDRAEARGISGLGGENIARGQANAQSVMDSWMQSPGHKANILNCDYRTLGVGAHFAEGGPWWTQDFGF